MTELTGPLVIKSPECLTRMEIVREVLNEGVVIADEHHHILFVNSQFVEMTGIPRQDLIRFASSHFYCRAGSVRNSPTKR